MGRARETTRGVELPEINNRRKPFPPWGLKGQREKECDCSLVKEGPQGGAVITQAYSHVQTLGT